MELCNKKVVVVGTGVSGIGAVKLLAGTGAVITLYDGNEKADRNAIMAKLPENVEVELIIGAMPQHTVNATDLLVISPGVPIDSQIVGMFEDAGVPVWGEIELAYNYEKGTVYAITGTNGKTTTTSLVGEIMSNYNEKTYVVGNIGTSYTGKVKETSEDSITVAEISSFQLETIQDFAPRGTAILNITPDHLDRHYTMENYGKVKESITKNQWVHNADDFCVLNFDDEELRRFGDTLPNAIYFSRKNKPKKGAYLSGSMIRYVADGLEEDIVSVEDMHIFGNHNYENVMAAIALTKEAGVPVDIIRETVKSFKGVEHRIEYVRELNGVKYYNDSKGTNPDSSIKALEAMSRPTILIAGGYDKHSEFDEFIDAFDNKVKLLVLLGQTAEQIESTARSHGFDKIVRTDNLKEAVEVCYKNAEEGDVVLLSPACASWGMFTNYEERGILFKEYVNELK
jgi:UDP-N-acetylmuramoylalanine--D-glutamate ligase